MQAQLILFLSLILAYVINLIVSNIAVISGLDIKDLFVSTKRGKVLLLQRPSQTEETDQETFFLKLDPGYPKENPIITLIFEGQYGNIRALETHPSLNVFALGGDSGNLSLINFKDIFKYGITKIRKLSAQKY